MFRLAPLFFLPLVALAQMSSLEVLSSTTIRNVDNTLLRRILYGNIHAFASNRLKIDGYPVNNDYPILEDDSSKIHKTTVPASAAQQLLYAMYVIGQKAFQSYALEYNGTTIQYFTTSATRKNADA